MKSPNHEGDWSTADHLLSPKESSRDWVLSTMLLTKKKKKKKVPWESSNNPGCCKHKWVAFSKQGPIGEDNIQRTFEHDEFKPRPTIHFTPMF